MYQTQLPFAAKWNISENDLIALKDSTNGCLRSTYVTTSAGIQYGFQILPNGNRDANRGKVFVFLVLMIGNIKEVDVKCTIRIESTNNCTQEIEHVFKESGGWGKCLCNTADLFDAQKGFIRNGKMELKVDGLFFEKIERTDYGVTSAVGDDLWASEETKDFEILVDGKSLKAHKLVLASASRLFYGMFIFHEHEMFTFDQMLKSKQDLKNQLVISEFSFKTVEYALKEIYSCNYKAINLVFEELIQFFDKFDMPSLMERHNIFAQTTGKNVRKSIPHYRVGENLFERNDSKDYTIMVDGKTILVHKLILAARSSTFATMLRSNTKEADQLEICGFSFYIVEQAIRAIYEFIDGYNLNDLLLIMEFLYKYGFTSTKNYFESLAICRIDGANVCRLVNGALTTNSTKLQDKCMEFIMSAFARNTPLHDVDKLNKNVALKIVQKSGFRIADQDAAVKLLEEFLYQYVYTQKKDVSMMPALK